MKTLKNIIILFTAAVLLSASYSASATLSKEKIKGNGNISKRVFILSDFNQISVAKGIDLCLEPSDKNEATVVTDENVLDALVIEQTNGRLNIDLNKSVRKTTEGIKVYLSYKQMLTAIKASIGCNITSSNNSTIKSDKLSLTALVNCKMNLNLDVKDLDCELSTNSIASLCGKVENVNADLTVNSDLNAKQLESIAMEIDARVNSDAFIKAPKSLKANAQVNSDITIYGQPEKISTSTSINSKIYKK